MTDSVVIEVVDRVTGSRFTRVLPLPVQIGKQRDAGNAILLDEKYATISRVHGTIEMRDGALVYRDESSNGTLVDGKHVRGSHRAISDQSKLTIENYDLLVQVERPVFVHHTSGTLDEKGGVRLEAGVDAVIHRTDDGLHISNMGEEADTPSDPIVRLSLTDEGLTCLRLQDGIDVLINKNRLGADMSPIRLFDVVNVSGDRFEILELGEARVVCGNTACHLINPLVFEQNCKWCGFHLAGGGAFTRFVPDEPPGETNETDPGDGATR